MKMKMKNRSRRHDIKRPTSKHAYKHSKSKMYQYDNGYMY